MALPPVTIYSTRFCPYCRRAEALLEHKEIPFQKIDLTTDIPLRREVVKKTGWYTVPIVMIGENLVGGYDELRELEQNGELDTLLDSNKG